MSAIPPTISLVHATYHREGGVDEIIEARLGSARQPDRVEYVLARDADDPATTRHRSVVTVTHPPDPVWSTAVRNWNAAAAAATGDLLLAIADDLYPSDGWDDHLRRLTGGLDPRRVDYAIKIGDSPRRRDVQLRHPVLSRRFYELFGLYDPRFHGLGCGMDLTRRAFWTSLIIDGRDLRVEHRHPTRAHPMPSSRSQARQNREPERRHAIEMLGTWPRRKSMATVVLVPAAAVAGTTAADRERLVRRTRRRGVVNAIGRGPGLLMRPAIRRLRRRRPVVGSGDAH